jgi:hypothetical protein
MHLLRTETNPANMTEPKPFGFGFTESEVVEASRMEVWGTSFTDTEEYTEARLFDGDGAMFRTSRVEGY